MNQAVKELYDQYVELVMLNNKLDLNKAEEVEFIHAKFDSLLTKILTNFLHKPSVNEVEACLNGESLATSKDTPIACDLFETIPENMLWWQPIRLLLGRHKLPIQLAKLNAWKGFASFSTKAIPSYIVVKAKNGGAKVEIQSEKNP